MLRYPPANVLASGFLLGDAALHGRGRARGPPGRARPGRALRLPAPVPRPELGHLHPPPERALSRGGEPGPVARSPRRAARRSTKRTRGAPAIEHRCVQRPPPAAREDATVRWDRSRRSGPASSSAWCWLAFRSVVGHPFLNWDDPQALVRNEALDGPGVVRVGVHHHPHEPLPAALVARVGGDSARRSERVRRSIMPRACSFIF